MAEERDLALFPLNVVLFPGMALPLHIFEPRYREMIGHCLETQDEFGVVLIEDGFEVGEPAIPVAVGTAARIVSVERLPDGRLNLVTVGTRRFRCLEHRQERPYRLARVAWFDDEAPPAAASASLGREVQAAAEAYVAAAYALANQPRRPVTFPEDVAVLSFQIAALLRIGAAERQQLLETTRVEERLEQELRYLRRETRMLELRLLRREGGDSTKFSRN